MAPNPDERAPGPFAPSTRGNFEPFFLLATSRETVGRLCCDRMRSDGRLGGAIARLLEPMALRGVPLAQGPNLEGSL